MPPARCYMPFGEAFVDEHSTRPGMPYKFNGKEQDAETGLYYYGARYYDAGECRFYGVDPLAEQHPNYNPVAYCYNNPVNFIDPLGLDTLAHGATGVKAGDVYNNGDGTYTPAQSTQLNEVTVTADKKTDNTNGNVGSSNGTNEANSGGGSNAMDLGNIGNYFIGIGATIGETNGSTYRLMKGGSFSPKLYSSGWLGGSRASIKTFSLAKTARGIGGATIVVGGVLDGVGVFTYYMNGPDNGLSVHPGKAGLNLGVGVYSFYLNPIAGGVYFGIDLLYPGGWGGYMNDTDRVIQRNQEILGPGWNMYRMEGGLK